MSDMSSSTTLPETTTEEQEQTHQEFLDSIPPSIQLREQLRAELGDFAADEWYENLNGW